MSPLSTVQFQRCVLANHTAVALTTLAGGRAGTFMGWYFRLTRAGVDIVMLASYSLYHFSSGFRQSNIYAA